LFRLLNDKRQLSRGPGRYAPMRLTLPILLSAALAACSSGDKWAENAATPTLTTMTEQPGDWSALEGMIGRRPSESGLIERSPVSVDMQSRLGPAAKAYRDAMMRAGPLTRRGALLVAEGPDAWLVLDPDDRAFRAGLLRNGRLEEWQTAGADVPRPR
jgi:hypothetical protein